MDSDCNCFTHDDFVEFDWNLNKPSSKQIKAPYPNKYSTYRGVQPQHKLEDGFKRVFKENLIKRK